jgi:hypothetical protein
MKSHLIGGGLGSAEQQAAQRTQRSPLPLVLTEGGRSYTQVWRSRDTAIYLRSAFSHESVFLYFAWQVAVVSGAEWRGELMASGENLDALMTKATQWGNEQ